MSYEPALPDPRLADWLADYPASMFSDTLYQSCELAHRYTQLLAYQIATDLGLLVRRRAPLLHSRLIHDEKWVKSFASPLAWLLANLAESGWLLGDLHSGFIPSDLAPPPVQTAAELRQLALRLDPANRPTFDLLDVAAQAYPQIAVGQLRGEEALFSLDRLTLWLDYFDNAHPIYAVNNQVAAEAFTRFVGTRHAGGLKVLEFGAGAGSGTLAVLQRLRAEGTIERIGAYRMTEPNGFFRRRGQRALNVFARQIPIQFAALDIDRPWVDQDLGHEQFDLIFAVNALHVAADLPATLSEIRQRLNPGGQVIVGECIRPFAGQPIYNELVFRLLRSYAVAEVPAAMTDPVIDVVAGGFLTPEQWSAAFQAAGFEAPRLAPDVVRIRAIHPRFFTTALSATTA